MVFFFLFYLFDGVVGLLFSVFLGVCEGGLFLALVCDWFFVVHVCLVDCVLAHRFILYCLLYFFIVLLWCGE